MRNLRTYGNAPFRVAVVHGGPGAPGEMAPVARELAPLTGVLEPLQTQKSLEGQLQELRAVLEANGDPPVTLVGWSWGAWLSYMLAARYPSLVKKLVLIGSGAFEEKYVAGIMAERLSRLSEEKRVELLALIEAINDPATRDRDAAMGRFGQIIAGADSYDPLPHENEVLEYSYEINQNAWQEADELRSCGRLLEIGREITCPVVAIHGDHDPHLAEGVREPLSRVIKDFRFILLEKCGHEPWFERFARERFYELLKAEI